MSTIGEWSGSRGVSEYAEVADERFPSFLHAYGERYGVDISSVGETITRQKPVLYVTMEIYDKQDLDIKGGGGLGVLAADTRRVAEDLGAPLVVVTPFYPVESHQELQPGRFYQVERHEPAHPDKLYRRLGGVAVRTTVDSEVPLDIYGRTLGSTRVIAVTEPHFNELYPGSNSGDHRLYQEMALGFAGYEAVKNEGLDPAFIQLNEAPTVFAAIAMLDDLCTQGMAFDEAFETVKTKLLYTNHTLVQAVEGEFNKGQFVHMIRPNIANQEVWEWVESHFSEGDGGGQLRLSLLAIELAGVKSGVSELHARESSKNFRDFQGEPVHFEAVTNGISDKWVMREAIELLEKIGARDEYGLPTRDYADRLEDLPIDRIREIRKLGRQEMNRVLATRKDQYGNPVFIPEAATAFDFKRRFAEYKRPDMIFSDPERLAALLEQHDMHFLLTGKPHPSDEPMKRELTRLLYMIDSSDTLRERVHYIQDYDEPIGRALSVGADFAINVPRVGEEACGTSFMKDMANFKVLVSTVDGGVADADPASCIIVEDGNAQSLYEGIDRAARIVADDEALLAQNIRQLQAYLPVISGARMLGDYMRLFASQTK
jgi:starch phosphorylase